MIVMGLVRVRAKAEVNIRPWRARPATGSTACSSTCSAGISPSDACSTATSSPAVLGLDWKARQPNPSNPSPPAMRSGVCRATSDSEIAATPKAAAAA